MKQEKNVFQVVVSLILIAGCLFSLFAGVKGINDFLEIKDYKTEEKEEGLANIDLLLDGIAQLKENEGTYNNGVATYNAGLASYYAGQKSLAEGAAKLDAGEAQYAAGQQTLQNGYAQYNAGKAELDANTDAYNEGKQKLALAEGLITIGQATGVGDPMGLQQQIDEGKPQLEKYEAGQKQLAEAEKQLQDGEQKLAAAQKELQAGYATYNAGVDQLNSGAAQLANGKTQLSVFEDGASQVAYGMAVLMSQPTIYDGSSDRVAVKSVADRLGKDFSYWKLNADGTIMVVNGCQYLDFDNCLLVCKAGQNYIADTEADVTQELMSRANLYIVLFIICILGTIAGIKGVDAAYAPKRLEGTAFLGMITAVLAIGGNAYGLISGYTDYTYPLENGAYSGNLQFIAYVVIAVLATVFAVVTYSAMSSYKKALADGSIIEDEEELVLEDPGDLVEDPRQPANIDSVEDIEALEKQKAELQKMMDSLSSKIDDIKSKE